MKSAYFYFFKIFLYFFSVVINIHEYTNYANMITCLFDHRMKGLCLSFSNLLQKAAEILFILYEYPHFGIIFLMFFLNIYGYANKIICICDKGIIGLCLNFNLVLSLVF